LNFSYSGVEWFSFFEKFISPGFIKVAYDYDSKVYDLELFKNLRSSYGKWGVKMETFEKKFIVESKFEVCLKNNLVLFLVANSSLNPKMCIFCMFGDHFQPLNIILGKKFKKLKFLQILPFFNLTVKFDLQTCALL
jgi:hypothetical protein